MSCLFASAPGVQRAEWVQVGVSSVGPPINRLQSICTQNSKALGKLQALIKLPDSNGTSGGRGSQVILNFKFKFQIFIYYWQKFWSLLTFPAIFFYYIIKKYIIINVIIII